MGQPELNARTDELLTSIDRRLDTIINDLAHMKGWHALAVAVDYAAVIALDMGLQYTRTLSRLELVWCN